MPPDGNTCTVPLQGAPKALQLAGVAVYVAVRVAQSPPLPLVTVAVKVAIQPFASVRSKTCVPAHTLLIVNTSVRKVVLGMPLPPCTIYGAVPPLIVKVIVPVHAPNALGVTEAEAIKSSQLGKSWACV